MTDLSATSLALRILLILVITGLVAGCATMTRGSKQTFVVQTEPEGAVVELSNGVSCESPCRLELKRKHDFTATISLDGHETLVTDVGSGVSGAGSVGLAGNLIGLNVVGIAVDATTGAAKDLYPNPLIVKLAPLDSGAESMLVSALDLNQSQMKKRMDGAFGIEFGEPMTAEILLYKIDAGAFAKSYEVKPPMPNPMFNRYYVALDNERGGIKTIWANGIVKDTQSCLVIMENIEGLLERRYVLEQDANGLTGIGQRARVSCLESLDTGAAETDIIIQVWLRQDAEPEMVDISNNLNGYALGNTAK